jgi:NTP pyrophosphatase (non-canonical NTP hydrolase)
VELVEEVMEVSRAVLQLKEMGNKGKIILEVVEDLLLMVLM